MTPSVAFTVFGLPQPKGSARAFIRGGHAVVTSANRNLRAWEDLIRAEAQRHAGALLTGPVRLVLDVYLPRPKTLPKRVTRHVKRPDLSKLIRGVEDALTGLVWQDDSQVCAVTAAKHYAAPGTGPRITLCVVPIEDAAFKEQP